MKDGLWIKIEFSSERMNHMGYRKTKLLKLSTVLIAVSFIVILSVLPLALFELAERQTLKLFAILGFAGLGISIFQLRFT